MTDKAMKSLINFLKDKYGDIKGIDTDYLLTTYKYSALVIDEAASQLDHIGANMYEWLDETQPQPQLSESEIEKIAEKEYPYPT